MDIPKKIVAIRRVSYDTDHLIEIIHEASGFAWKPGDDIILDVEETIADLIHDFVQEDLSCGFGHRIEKDDYKLYLEDGVTEW